MMIPAQQLLDTAHIAVLLGISPQAVSKRAKERSWTPEPLRKQGGGHIWRVGGLDEHTQEELLPKLTRRYLEQFLPDPQKQRENEEYIAACWEKFARKTDKQRERAVYRCELCIEVGTMHARENIPLYQAFVLVADKYQESVGNLRNWWYGTANRKGVNGFDSKDWLAILIDDYKGRVVSAFCDDKAWDFFLKDYMRMEKPSFSACYRNLLRVAAEQGWTVPSEQTLRRRLKKELSAAAIRYKREGSMRFAYPDQERRRDAYESGEAMSADGLRFDKIYVYDDIHGTGEVCNPYLWAYEDVRSAKILAWESGVTENTGVMRKASRNLLDICLPSHIYIDNTTAAANKCMTGKVPGRKRFKDLSTDPVGLFPMAGIQVHFTNPPKKEQGNNAGSKPIERAFGKGGLHDSARNWPAFMSRGWSQRTAIPYSEFLAELPKIIAEHNSRTGRRGGICNGRSFDEVFNESFTSSTVRMASQEIKNLFEKEQEVCTVTREGTVRLNAGKGLGKHRYHSEKLAHLIGEKVAVFYNPDNLSSDVIICDLEGRRIGEASWLPSVAFNDTQSARTYHKDKRRRHKLVKRVADTSVRMSDAEFKMLNGPHAPLAEIPQPGRTVTRLSEHEVEAKLRHTVSPERQKELRENLQKNIAEGTYLFAAKA